MPWKLESFLICQDDRLCEFKTTDGADESFNKTIFANLVIHCVAADDVVHVTLYQILGRVDDSSKISLKSVLCLITAAENTDENPKVTCDIKPNYLEYSSLKMSPRPLDDSAEKKIHNIRHSQAKL